MRIAIVLLLTLSIIACATKNYSSHVKGLESSRALGHGFWLAVVAENVEGGFEATGHFGYCYYKDRNLGRCDRMSPSPSGRLSVYQEAASGHIYLFDVRTSKSTSLTSTFPGLMRSASWQEAETKVAVQVGTEEAERTILLSVPDIP